MQINYITIPGKPQGKARPRFNSNTKRTYTPESTKAYEDAVRQAYIEKYGFVPVSTENGLSVQISAIFPIPKRINKEQKAKMRGGMIPVTKKPDVDNISKIILDALNGLAYEDDSQVTQLNVIKEYGEEAEVHVCISQIEARKKQ